MKSNDNFKNKVNYLFLNIINFYLFILKIWVQSPHNASGYFTIYGDDSSYQDHFNARLVTGGTGEVYARTGYLGFLRRTEAIGSDGGIYEKISVKLSHYFDYIFFQIITMLYLLLDL